MAIRRSRFLKRDGPTSRLSGDCKIAGCSRPRFRNDLCSAHFKRWQRGKIVDAAPIGAKRVVGGTELGETLDPVERVMSTARTLADCSSEDDRAWHDSQRAHLRACETLFLSLGWTPPANRTRYTYY